MRILNPYERAAYVHGILQQCPPIAYPLFW